MCEFVGLPLPKYLYGPHHCNFRATHIIMNLSPQYAMDVFIYINVQMAFPLQLCLFIVQIVLNVKLNDHITERVAALPH